jgi:aminoglycoside 6'-N-acetyltransferase I
VALQRVVTTRVRPVERKDATAWLLLRQALWPEDADGEHAAEIEEFFAGRSQEPQAVVIADDENGRPIGFAELSIRACAEECSTSRIGFLEGWYVVPEARRKGVGRILVQASESWARSQGCTEFASDTQPDNGPSMAAHRALGFTDAGRIQCYRKDL